MRVVLLILLIALAPLRGMANELMATRMAAALTTSMATNAHHGNERMTEARALDPCDRFVNLKISFRSAI